MTPKHYQDIVYKIIGAAMEVYNELGWGLLEPIYQEALKMELDLQGINAEREVKIQCYYKNHKMEKFYSIDLKVDDVIIELKAVSELSSEHRSQLFNYMRLTKSPIGLLINFGSSDFLQGERYMLDLESGECYRLDKNMDPL